MAPIAGDWQEALKGEFHQPYYAKLYKTVMTEYRTRKIFPPPEDLFNAFHFTPLHQVKVVILGQDPYHNDGQAHGLCFSVKKGVETPPSLVNIYKELEDDMGCYIPNNGNLEKWAKQGVLLLNTVLTVRAHQANSHRGIGWEQFTDAAIRILDQEDLSDRISSLGTACPDEGIHASQSEASDPGSTTSKPPFCLSGIFWMQAFQQGQRISESQRGRTH